MAIVMQIPESDGKAKGLTPSSMYGYEIYTEKTYEGCVIDTWEKNHTDDSDFYALAWNEETQSCKVIEYASTRGWTYANGAKIDATPEIIEKAYAWNESRLRIYLTRKYQQKSTELAQGRKVEVVRGRKIPTGTIGYVMDVFESRFGTCAKIQVGNEAILTSASNLIVKDPSSYEPPAEEINRMAHAARTNFCLSQGVLF